jgi:hypothetical protein
MSSKDMFDEVFPQQKQIVLNKNIYTPSMKVIKYFPSILN